MTLLKRFLFRLKTLFNGGSKESDLDEELQYHLEMAAAEYEEKGMDSDAAKKRAVREFGNTESLREDCRDSWGIRVVMNLIRDLRYSAHASSGSRIR